jgi:hypothetical protein
VAASGNAVLPAQDGDPAHGEQRIGRGGELDAVDDAQGFQVDIRLEKAVEQ